MIMGKARDVAAAGAAPDWPPPTPSWSPRSCSAPSARRARCRSAPVRTGSRCDLTGTVSTVTINPRGGHPALEVELRDGSGAVTLVWLGRRQIPGSTRAADQGLGPDQLSGRAAADVQPALRAAADRVRLVSGAEHHGRRPAAVPLRRGVRPLPAVAVPRRPPRDARGRAAVRRLHRRLGDRPRSSIRRWAPPSASPSCWRWSGWSSASRCGTSLRPSFPTAIAAFVATRTGRAEDVFLPGILYNGALAVLSLFTVPIRRPLVGFVIGAAVGDPTGWAEDRGLVKMTSKLTAGAGRPVRDPLRVQLPLFLAGRWSGSAWPRSSSAGRC